MSNITQENIVEYVKDNPLCSSLEICRALVENFDDLNDESKHSYRTRVNKRLRSLSKALILKRKDAGKNSYPYYQYWIND